MNKSVVCRICKHLDGNKCLIGELTAPDNRDDCWRFSYKHTSVDISLSNRAVIVNPLDRSGRST